MSQHRQSAIVNRLVLIQTSQQPLFRKILERNSEKSILLLSMDSSTRVSLINLVQDPTLKHQMDYKFNRHQCTYMHVFPTQHPDPSDFTYIYIYKYIIGYLREPAWLLRLESELWQRCAVPTMRRI